MWPFGLGRLQTWKLFARIQTSLEKGCSDTPSHNFKLLDILYAPFLFKHAD